MYVKFTLRPKVDEPAVVNENETYAQGTHGWRTSLHDGHNVSRRNVEEPLEDEVIEAYVGHVGSCNTNDGCTASTSVHVNRDVQYVVTVTTALVDMVEPSEKLVSVSVGGHELGECNPSPEDDFDCGYEDCFSNQL